MSNIREIQGLFRDAIRLFKIAWVQKRGLLTMTAVVVVFVSLVPFIQGFAFGQLLNGLVSATGHKLNSRSSALLSIFLVCGLVIALASTLQFFLKTVVYKELFQMITVMIHERIAGLDIATHEDPKRKDLLNRVQENAMWRAPDFVQRMTFLFQNSIEVIVASFVFGSIDWRLGLVVFGSIVPRVGCDIKYNHNLWVVETSLAEVRRKFWYARHFLTETRALNEVKLLQAVNFFVNLVKGHLERVKQAEIKAERRNLKAQLLSLVLFESVAMVVIAILVHRTIKGEVAVGNLAFYIGALTTFRMSLNSLSQNIGNQLRDGKFVRDMFEAFDLPPTLTMIDPKSARDPGSIQEIDFENVSFAYPGTDRLVLKGINLKLRIGQTLGIVAENGAGKSTLAKLLCRIYDPTTGRILANGIDIREFDLDKWQARIGVMLQNYSHYEHLEIEQAVRLGRTSLNGSVGFEAVQNAARLAEAHEFIQRLPLKYDTVLGPNFDGGVDLAGGEYQRLAIARIHFRNAEVAILDEPTSAIDGEAEARIFEQILGQMPNALKILISHRFYTLRKADIICLIQAGRVSECGTHAELIALDGVYAQRYRSQAAEYH